MLFLNHSENNRVKLSYSTKVFTPRRQSGMEVERQERREIGEEERVANIAIIETIGLPESSVQVVFSQTYGDAQKRKALSAISGNSVEKEIKKIKATEKKKGAKSFINAFISQETRIQTETIKISINIEVANYILEIKKRIYRICDKEQRKVITTIQNIIRKLEKEYKEIKNKVVGLETQNKKLLYIVKVQTEKLKAFFKKIKILTSNMTFQTASRPVIIPIILIRLVKTPIYKNKEKIINKIIIALRTPASYVQIITKNSFDLNKS